MCCVDVAAAGRLILPVPRDSVTRWRQSTLPEKGPSLRQLLSWTISDEIVFFIFCRAAYDRADGWNANIIESNKKPTRTGVWCAGSSENLKIKVTSGRSVGEYRRYYYR